MTASAPSQTKAWPDYRAVWRWHFYAGLFCIPFVCWLACTGPIYLFKPQVEAWLDRPFAHVVRPGQSTAPPSAQVRAALAVRPGTVLHAYQLPAAPGAAPQVLIGRGADEWRVWIDPKTLTPLKVMREDDRFMKVIFRIHGELLLGDRGSMAVELAASWAIVMIVTGLYLWWPRGVQGLGGLLYPRLGLGERIFWRDLHACAGVWVSALALMLLLSGLPWAKSWGGYLKETRRLAGAVVRQQDWTIGTGSERAARVALSAESLAGQQRVEVDPMAGMAMDHADMAAMHKQADVLPSGAYSEIDQVAPTVARQDLDYPVLITPPLKPGGPWSARSDAQNRPRRVNLSLNGQTGAMLSRQDFGQRDWVDQAVGYGVAAHEGQLFGWPNQVLGLVTALGLLTVSISAVVLWWRRRASGVLGAPAPFGRPRFSVALLAIVVILGVLLPLFGASLVLVAVADRLLLRRLPIARDWLGLASA